MRTPTNKRIANRIVKAAATDDGGQVLIEVAEMIQDAYAIDPFMTRAKLKEQVITNCIEQHEMNQLDAHKYFRAAETTVIPFLQSGSKIAQADAQLDKLNDIINIAIKGGFHILSDKEGNTRIDTNLINAATKVIGTKMNSLAKIQQNVISAKRDQQVGGADKEFNLKDAEREQLERYIAGELMDNPEVIEMISQKINRDDPLEGSWCE